MVFEPRLIRPDDDSDDAAALPPELAKLGLQLEQDAQLLAARFPGRADDPGRSFDRDFERWVDAAHAFSAQAVSARSSSARSRPAAAVAASDPVRGLIRGLAVAVVVVGVGLWCARLRSPVARRPGSYPLAAPSAADAGPSAADAKFASAASENVGLPGRPGAQAKIVEDAAAPAAPGWFRGLSGGEQEGVLDLLEEQPVDPAQVSI